LACGDNDTIVNLASVINTLTAVEVQQKLIDLFGPSGFNLQRNMSGANDAVYVGPNYFIPDDLGDFTGGYLVWILFGQTVVHSLGTVGSGHKTGCGGGLYLGGYSLGQ
jgi:hypothetical protein